MTWEIVVQMEYYFGGRKSIVYNIPQPIYQISKLKKKKKKRKGKSSTFLEKKGHRERLVLRRIL